MTLYLLTTKIDEQTCGTIQHQQNQMNEFVDCHIYLEETPTTTATTTTTTTITCTTTTTLTTTNTITTTTTTSITTTIITTTSNIGADSKLNVHLYKKQK